MPAHKKKQTKKQPPKTEKTKKVLVLFENHNGELMFYLVSHKIWRDKSFQIKLHREKADEEGCDGGDDCPYNIPEKEHERGGVEPLLKKHSERRYNFWLDDHSYDVPSDVDIVHIARFSEQL